MEITGIMGLLLPKQQWSNVCDRPAGKGRRNGRLPADMPSYKHQMRGREETMQVGAPRQQYKLGGWLDNGGWGRAGRQALQNLQVVQEKAHGFWVQHRHQIRVDAVVNQAVPLRRPCVRARTAAAQAHNSPAGQLVRSAGGAGVALAHAAHGEWFACAGRRGREVRRLAQQVAAGLS